MLQAAITIDEMFPKAEPVMRPPLPHLKTTKTYQYIRQQAQRQGLTLRMAHMQVSDCVLDFYEHCDDCQNARQLADLMQAEFAEQGGRKYLYQLFPNGPLNTIHDLANLPDLNHQRDKSFGTRW